MQNPGDPFEQNRQADVNVVSHRCALDLNNYALTSAGASASASSTFSADWPASGAIDGDRTHINAGAAVDAENGIGGSTWQGNVVSDVDGNLSPPEELVIDLGQERTFNRLKIFWWPSRTCHGNEGPIAPADFTIGFSTEAPGYGEGGYGIGPYGGPSPAADLIDVSSEYGFSSFAVPYGEGPYGGGPYGGPFLDGGTVTGNDRDFNAFETATDVTARYITITISKLQSPGARARVCAIEITRSVDITEDVINAMVARRKDYRLNRRLAAELNLTLTNFDRKYSPSYEPNATELAAGYFNEELRPNLEIRYFQGFSDQNVQVFTGYIDRIAPDGQARTVNIKARDFFKFFQKEVTTALKTNETVECLTELLANLSNFASNLYFADTSRINIAFFMPKDAVVMDQMQELGDATGDSEVYIDEFGRLNYRSYLNVVSKVFQINSAADFQAGTVNNTDVTTVPGELRLALSGPNYVSEGTWESALSPVLDGKVEFTLFESAYQAGTSGSVTIYARTTSDGGTTFSPYRELASGADPGQLDYDGEQVQFLVRLRTSDPSQTPMVFSLRMVYHARGGSAKVAGSSQYPIHYDGVMLGLQQVLTDEVGGSNYMITKSIVKSKPTFLAAGATEAWIGTVNNEAISVSNPLFVPVGTTTFQVDFGDTRYDTPQTVVATAGSAVFTTSLTDHPSKPVLTIDVTTPGTITELKITGTPFTQLGIIEAVTLADQLTRDNYNERTEVLENNYIDNEFLASDISRGIISRFSHPITWLPDVPIRFTPNSQLNDRVNVNEPNTGLDDDFQVIGIQNDLASNGAQGLTAETRLEMVKVGDDAVVCDPAFFGSDGRFYYDNFQWGGCHDRHA